MSDCGTCHKRYDQDYDWWRCDVHGKVTKADYEDEYETEAKPPASTKKPRPVAKPPTKKTRPAPAADKKPRPDDGDDGDDGDDEEDLNAPPDKDDKGGEPEPPAKPKGFGWG